MIPFDFDYLRPATIKEAVEAYRQLDEAGREPVWYGGGTELISMARVGSRRFGAVIDLKAIPECRALGDDGDYMLFGAGLTLEEIRRAGKFPLLCKTAGRVADHTVQCKITLGGNLAATIIYRETVLPLLLSGAVITTAGVRGIKRYPIGELCQQQRTLPKGEFIVGASVARKYDHAAYFHIKKTKNEKIDYPLLTTDALIMDGWLRIAFSGLAAYPVRNKAVEDILNNASLTQEERAEKAARQLDGVLLNDTNGSAAYRRFVLKNTMVEILESVKKAGISC